VPDRRQLAAQLGPEVRVRDRNQRLAALAQPGAEGTAASLPLPCTKERLDRLAAAGL